jgi:glycosyltransferase involved in cell wall biosynthesis
MRVWNGEESIRDGLDSLLGQTFSDFEIVISDNASSDATQDSCEDYVRRDSRLRYSRNDHNAGVDANFARVLDLATAPYFMWACHDDRWHPSYISRMVTVLDSRGSVVSQDGSPRAKQMAISSRSTKDKTSSARIAAR